MKTLKRLLASALLLFALSPLALAVAYSGYAHLDTAGQVPVVELGNVFNNVSNQLASVSGINLKTTGQTTLYTCPNGKTCVITDVLLLVTGANTIAVPPILRIGKASSYNEWLPLTTLTGLDTTNKFTSLAVSAALLMHQTFAGNDVVKVDVQTGATATTLTVTAYVFGFTF